MLPLVAILLFLNPAIPAQNINKPAQNISKPVQNTSKPAQTDKKALTPLQVVEYTLKLEKLESNFYHRGIEATKNGGLRELPQEVKDAIASFCKDDEQHVENLSNILKNYKRDPGKINIPKDIDYKAILGRNPFANSQDFLLAIQLIEDLGVAAYKGQMQNLLAAGISGKAILAAAIEIHSVEARHAAGIRSFREKLIGDKVRPWIEDPYEVIYPENRNNTSIPFQSQAFDSYATKEEVLNLLNSILATDKPNSELNNEQASSQYTNPIRALF
ncbi:MAG TPA: ferritin-like domain-containing protein [Oculatellaceae cyanobacterium]